MATTVATRPNPALPPPPSKLPHADRKRGNWRKTFFRLHGWLGLNAGLLLFVICFSGSFATLSHEIDWLLNPAIRAETREAPYDWTAMHQTLAEAFPEGQTLGVYAPVEPGFAAMAYVAVPDGQTRKVYLDPYTGALQGHTSFFDTQRFFRSFHRRFFDETRGIVIVTLTAFVLLFSAATGFFFYKGWLKQLVTLRRGKGPRLLWSDLHKTTGIWALAFTLLIALTGIFYFVEVVFQSVDRYDALLPPLLPSVEEASLGRYGPQPALLAAEVYVQAAKDAHPNLQVRTMRMPLNPGEPVYLDGQAGNPIVRDRANKVLVHPFSGDVIAVQHTADLGAVPFITDAVDPLHFGYFGGLATKILWCLFGLIVSFSILAGTYLWVVRSEPVRAAARDLPVMNGKLEPSTFPWLRGAVAAFALTLAYFLIVVFATVRGIQDYRTHEVNSTVVTETEVGPYRVRIDAVNATQGMDGLTYTVRFLGEGLPNYREATLGPASTSGATLQGPAGAPSATLNAGAGTPLRIRVVTRDGGVHETTFPAPTRRPPSTLPASALPDTAPGVWWVIGVFVTLTMGAVAGWFSILLRAFRAMGQKAPRPQHIGRPKVKPRPLTADR